MKSYVPDSKGKCANPLCKCMTRQRYCCEYCENAEDDDDEEDCLCGHKACRQHFEPD
jgi:hypothetical protein